MNVYRWTCGASLAALMSLGAVGGPPSAAAKPHELPAYVPGRFLVRFHSEVGKSRAEAALQRLGVQAAREMEQTGLQVVQSPAGLSEAEFAAALARNPEVAFVERDVILPAAALPNDPVYPSQWHLPRVAATDAWDTTTGREGIIIAILDTGVDPNHPDLAPKLVPGWNTWDNSANTTDVYGHGTMVAGTAGAIGNNAAGVASLAWDCKIMPVRVTPDDGYTTYSALAAGLLWAADHGARVANLSFQASASYAVADAAGYFQSRGGVVAIAAGNTGTDVTTPDNPYALTVGATDGADNVAWFSTRGPSVDLSAPGVGITSTTVGGGYGSPSGTSFSAPVVAGVAALVLSANPGLNSAQVQGILEQSADDLGATGWDPGFGAGRVNAAQAVALASTTEGVADQTAPAVTIVPPPGTGTVEVQAVDNIGVASVTLTAGRTAVGTLTSSPYLFTYAIKGGKALTLTATAVDWSGNETTSTLTVGGTSGGGGGKGGGKPPR